MKTFNEQYHKKYLSEFESGSICFVMDKKSLQELFNLIKKEIGG